MKRESVSESKLKHWLATNKDWKKADGKLKTRLVFKDFSAAINFMAELVETIDKLDHHPVWTNVYNRLDIELNTHDVGAITDLDLALAARISESYNSIT